MPKPTKHMNEMLASGNVTQWNCWNSKCSLRNKWSGRYLSQCTHSGRLVCDWGERWQISQRLQLIHNHCGLPACAIQGKCYCQTVEQIKGKINIKKNCNKGSFILLSVTNAIYVNGRNIVPILYANTHISVSAWNITIISVDLLYAYMQTPDLTGGG